MQIERWKERERAYERVKPGVGKSHGVIDLFINHHGCMNSEINQCDNMCIGGCVSLAVALLGYMTMPGKE